MNATAPPGPGTPPRLGTFVGVFTPTILTILGVIMYLRSGWVVANAGLWGSLAVVLLANAITLATTRSMSTLATSMKVGVGGAYFLLSRSTGLAIGGALGIPLYLSQALSVTLYGYGIAETATLFWPDAPVPLLAAVVVVLVAWVAGRSTELALKLQLPIMVLIAASLASLFLGVSWEATNVPAFGPPGSAGFWEVFAVFFPAVTGILAGVSLSGDLQEPERAIPLGALAAVVVGLVVYLAVPFALAYGADLEVLATDPMVWTRIAWVPALVLPGMLGAIFSSALGSILGAPRTLQALAQDGLLPEAFARTDPETGEPVNAFRWTAGVALAAVALGDLNVVATVLTMFFLTTYGMLNLVAATEALVGDPAWRPRIRTPWWISASGAFGCVVAMIAIRWEAAIAAVMVELVVYWVLARQSLETRWGDVRAGVWYTLVRRALWGLSQVDPDPRNWRPHVLVFSSDPERSIPMARFASDLGQADGIVTVTTLWVGEPEEHALDEVVARHRALLQAHGVVAFPEAVAVPDLEAGVLTVAQANGFAGMASNTALFGWTASGPSGLARLLRLTRRLERLHLSTVVVRLDRPPVRHGPGRRPTAVVWWKGMQDNGDLMLLFAYLLSRSDRWRRMRIRLRSVVHDAEQARHRRRVLEALVPSLRMDVAVDVVVASPDRLRATIAEQSADADLVFLGLGAVAEGSEDAVAASLHELVEGLPNVVLVRNAGPFRGQLAGPDATDDQVASLSESVSESEPPVSASESPVSASESESAVSPVFPSESVSASESATSEPSSKDQDTKAASSP